MLSVKKFILLYFTVYVESNCTFNAVSQNNDHRKAVMILSPSTQFSLNREIVFHWRILLVALQNDVYIATMTFNFHESLVYRARNDAVTGTIIFAGWYINDSIRCVLCPILPVSLLIQTYATLS